MVFHDLLIQLLFAKMQTASVAASLLSDRILFPVNQTRLTFDSFWLEELGERLLLYNKLYKLMSYEFGNYYLVC